MTIGIPPQAEKILHILNEAGYEAYIVGGCVRDALLSREPEDWDITTSAAPDQVKRLFRRTIDTGVQHGTVTVRLGGRSFEVTTYRIDGAYEDGRHPKEVSFTSSLEEDLKRRDFTVNAMAWHPDEGLIDFHHGYEDLQAGILRTVGDPRERFEEDALRILRAVRFAAQLGFTIEEKTLAAIREFAGQLEKISRERIQTELNKLLTSSHPEQFLTLYETGITAGLFPEFDAMMSMPQNNPWHCYTVGVHTIEAVKAIPADPVLRWAALLHDVGKLSTRTTDADGVDHFYGHAAVSADFAHRFLRELKFDNHTVDLVTMLVRFHDLRPGRTAADVRHAMNRVGAENFPRLLALSRADALAKSPCARERILPRLDEAERFYREIAAAGDCTCLKDLAVSGRDLIEAGMSPGKEIGETLNQLLDWVLDHPGSNTKEELLKRIPDAR